MNDRKILSYHHQFDSRRVDGLERLYSVVDHLRTEVRGCSTGFAYTEFPGTLVDFFAEDLFKSDRSQQIKLERRRSLSHPDMYSRVCMTVDLADGWIRRLGFPIYKSNKLWFPQQSERLLSSDLYQHLRPMARGIG